MNTQNIIIILLLLIVLYLIFLNSKQNLTTTYTNTPSNQSVSLTDPSIYNTPNNGYTTRYDHPGIPPTGYLNQRLGMPMLTSVRDPQDFIVGKTVRTGIAYEEGKGKPFVVEVLQTNIDPYREIYEYEIITKDGISIPLTINTNTLEDGDIIHIPELKKKLLFKKDSDYILTYTN